MRLLISIVLAAVLAGCQSTQAQAPSRLKSEVIGRVAGFGSDLYRFQPEEGVTCYAMNLTWNSAVMSCVQREWRP